MVKNSLRKEVKLVTLTDKAPQSAFVQMFREVLMEVQEALKHLSNCGIGSRKKWKKKIKGMKGEDPLDKLSEEERELVRAVRPIREWEEWRRTKAPWKSTRVVEYTVYFDPCPKCVEARKTLKSNQMEYLRLTDGWAEEKFEEITGKSLQEK